MMWCRDLHLFHVKEDDLGSLKYIYLVIVGLIDISSVSGLL